MIKEYNIWALRSGCSDWVQRTYGMESFLDKRNRAARVAEEGVELGQSEGVTKEQMLAIVERAYSRPAGKPRQELAGVVFTSLVYSQAAAMDALEEVSLELERVNALDAEHFRRKHREKFAAGTDLVAPV